MSLHITIQRIRNIIAEWDQTNYPWNSWREDQTRYAVIDPILRDLGWNTADPKECLIEYPMWDGHGNMGVVDYALFQECSAQDIANQKITPRVLIEAKSLRASLDPYLDQLMWYVRTSRMTEGLAVLTNGAEWRLYDVANLEIHTLLEVADITTRFRSNPPAKKLSRWLACEK